MEGDSLTGSMMAYRMPTIVNQRTENDTQAWVDDFLLNQYAEIQSYPAVPLERNTSHE
jgi:hypothetical protein